MNKKTAEKIFREIAAAKRILLALHISPDGDSISSTLAMYFYLKRQRKNVKIISFSPLPPRLSLIPQLKKIEEKIELENFSKLNFSDFDLFIALDSAQEKMITRSSFPTKFPSGFKIINIDHHLTNTRYGDINLVFYSSSTAEILYRLFNFWGVKIDSKLSKLLFWGILTDTGCFQYSNASAETFIIAADLLKKGASLRETVFFNFRSYSFKTLKYWGKILENLRIDESEKFIWSKISQKECEELGISPVEIEGAANLFLPVVLNTEFGIILNEETKDLVRGSMRSRLNFDVSKIALELGGGGHREAAGFSLQMSLDEAEKIVLETVRKYIK